MFTATIKYANDNRNYLRALACASVSVWLTACGGGSTDAGPVQSADASLAPSYLKSITSSVDGNGQPAPGTTTTAPTSTPTMGPATSTTALATTTLAVAAYATSTYALYVATTGSDSNPGTQAAPLKTILKASTVAKPGTVVRVAPGTYPGGIVTQTSGTATARISYVSTTKWGARIVPPANSVTRTAWTNKGNYVDIDGFEVDGTVGQSGQPWYTGIYAISSNTVVKNNHVHHIARAAGMCNSNGGSAINVDGSYGAKNDDVIGNVAHHIGVTGCHTVQGLYVTTPGANVKNNIVYQIGYAAIHLWHDANHINIANNTVFSSGYGILVGGGDHINTTLPADYINVANNIVIDNVYGIGEEGDAVNGSHNFYINNLTYLNTGSNLSLRHASSSDIHADPQFMSYVRTGGGNYHLKSSSPAINKGTTSYAPATDIDGTARPQGTGIDMGAYEYKAP